jgi:catechol 2,3-dioxygenase-like lactoylglutathione lyase family enzyme
MANAFRASRDVIIRTPNFRAAAEFYESVLGLHAASRSDTLAGFEAGGFRLYVEEGSAHGPVFEFLVGDLAAARAVLIQAGCAVVEEDPGVPRCYLRDPYGLVFNLGER